MKFCSHKQLTFFLSLVFILSVFLFQCKPEDKKDDSVLSLLLGTGAVATVAGGTTTPSTSDSKLRVFVTAATYSGNLGGINGADTKCGADANKPSTGTYKALLTGNSGANGVRYACFSDNATNCPDNPAAGTKNWVLQASKNYYRVDQATLVFTTNANSLIATIPTAVQAAAASYWSGFVPASATNWSLNVMCGGATTAWSDGTLGSNGTTGISTATTIADIKGNNIPGCDQLRNLLCVEQ
ncbi:DUF1554 domain-containing protein [Leptospira adleri]|uniref:DUF1554 domain-containing protein n=1 Tax=Leptospira adleri TaxID=2023186 RepID=A0A2M9YQR8_9LEPT|nr:DUF1554 domain-containing protein [Leptospira adleri]PJZ53886.1 hypothetical protein CH380_07740 [Leptospira adleri]PJZ63097.1 hypothetical protein CH376_04390 [Leptospira adleri]